MIIKKLYLDNFGKFKGYTLELGSMFNVIHGENEDGKSTIMGFILMMFYGHGGRSGDISKNPRKKFRPWNGEEMKGRIQFEHEGTNYRLERTFGISNTSDSIALWNEDLGQQIKLSSKATPGEEFFGVGENAFLRSVFISQGGSLLNADSKDDEITEKLLNLVTTGNEETSYEKAKNLLQNNEELLVSKNKKNGLLIRTREQLESLSEKKRVSIEQEKDKKDYATRVEQKIELKKEMENNKASIEKSYTGFSIYGLIKDHEEALKRVESRQTLLSNLNELETKLTTPFGMLDQSFYIEGDKKIKSYKEVLSDVKHQEVEAEESKRIVSELESNIPKAISEEVFKSVAEKEKQRKESEDILKMKKDKLRENETLFQKLQEKKERQLEFNEAKRSHQMAELGYQELIEEFEGQSRSFNMMNNEVEMLKNEGITLENNIQNEANTKKLREEALTSFEKDLKEKIEDAKLQLENARKPQEYVEEIQGGRELRKPILMFALLTLVAFIILGILIDPILFAGLVLSLLLFALSFKKAENRTNIRISTNENLIIENEERLKKIQSEGENRRSVEIGQIDLLGEKIKNLKMDFEIKQKQLQENKVSLQDLYNAYEVKKDAVEYSKLQCTKLYSLMEAAEKGLLRACNNLIETNKVITNEDLEDQRETISSLENQIESLSQELKDILSAYESGTIEEFSGKYYDYNHHMDLLENRKKELQENLEKQSDILKRNKSITEEILGQCKVYKALDNVSEAEVALEEIRSLIDEKEKVTLQLNAIDEHRNELEKTMSSEALKEKIRALKGKLEELTFENEVEYTDLEKMEELRESIEHMNQNIIEVREEIISLESEVREKYRNCKNTSQIENEIQEVKQKLVLQELDYEGLKLAKDTLVAAFEKMQSSFGPKVNKATQEVFERLTGGKYKEVMVSRDLNISFQDNNSQKMYDWAFLSGGTIEQVYLSLRLAISDLIIQDGKKRPLLLDDVFMQYDDKRAKDGLQFLKEYTSNKEVPIQSVLFTCHKRIIQWANEIPNVEVIELFSS